jgi:hypothetical protein
MYLNNRRRIAPNPISVFLTLSLFPTALPMPMYYSSWGSSWVVVVVVAMEIQMEERPNGAPFHWWPVCHVMSFFCFFRVRIL